MKKFGTVLLSILLLLAAAGCGEELPPEVRPPEAHTHILTEWTEAPKPTCTEDGEMSRRCTGCEFRETKPIPALGHQWASGKVVRRPTCTEAGEELTGVCARCGAGGQRIPIPATGHKLSEQTKHEPTCMQAGEIVKGCGECSYTEREVLPALGHAYGDVQKDAGGQYRVCTRCGNRDELEETLLYTINVTVEEDCDFVMTAQTSIFIYLNSGLYRILEGQTHAEVELPRGRYHVRLDLMGSRYLSGQVEMNEDKPLAELTVRNDPEFDLLIEKVALGDKMFNFLVKDTQRTDGAYKRLYELAAGKKLVYIDFFFVACTPCEALLEEHLAYYAALPEEVKRQLLVIMVDISGDTAENINNFRELKQIPEAFITMRGGRRVHDNVPNRGSVPDAVYLDGALTLVRSGGAAALKEMVEQYIPSGGSADES